MIPDNWRYSEAVAAEAYPKDPLVPLDDVFEDERGEIRNLLLSQITSIARIASKKGTTRANHWHKTDWHYAYVELGEVFYFERAVGENTIPEPRVFQPGEMFFTPPNREHCMLFTKDSVIFTFAKNRRSHVEHEADLIRVAFITPEIARGFIL